MAPPSTSSWRCPIEPSSSSRSGSGPDRSRQGWTLAPGGAAPSTTRTGSPRGAGASRTVSSGSSARTVPAPTRIASLSARRRVGVGPGLGARDPAARSVRGGGAAVERGSELQHHVRAPGAAVHEVRRQQVGGGPALDADRHVDAGTPQAVDPGPGDLLVGVLDRHHHARRRRRPPGRRRRVVCARGASTARGWSRPWRRPGRHRRSGRLRARRPRRGVRPTGRVAPSKTRPPAVSTTQPTQGFGDVAARTDAAKASARVIRSVSVAAVMSSPVRRGARGDDERCRRQFYGHIVELEPVLFLLRTGADQAGRMPRESSRRASARRLNHSPHPIVRTVIGGPVRSDTSR